MKIMISCEHSLFPKLTFSSVNEKDTFYDYLEFKGIFLHKHVYDAFLQYQDTVSYYILSTYIMYDKGLRNVLYRNLSAVEEKFRARLINNFDIDNELIDPINSTVKNSDLVTTDEIKSNLYKFSFSKNFTFDKLLSMLRSKNLLSEKENEDLDHIRIFRNKVMHHNLILIGYHVARKDIENEIRYVEELCEMIYKYLPMPMRNAFQGNLNKCNHLTSKNIIPNLEILCVREMKNGIFE